ncbi:thioredoxin fold domain-containing protein [Alteromonas gilva]|uniref:Thiol:disulfide interchange protein n=1 Tax=Alteromonas gilva TaxID=2987522 RepID=A0ABT5L7F3_9ALTE|nr:thioredoxin fold domain-containing protein [Alteromonas gilva]MDC8832980.1 thioredoxin fold domain-containing protein [Alteromonas gilva]
MNKVLSILLVAALAFTVKAQELNKTQISKKMQEVTPFEVQEVNDDSTGLYEIVTDKGIFYATKDGKNLISGRVYEFEGGMANKTQSRISELAVSKIEKLKDSFVTFKAPNEKHEVLVFFDVNCGYCRKMHNELSQYNAAGITVHYVLYPRNGIKDPRTGNTQFSNTYLTMQDIACSPNPNISLDMVMRSNELPTARCENQVAENYALGEWLGVRGTPAVYGMDGKQVVGGYAPTNKLLAVLERAK